MALHTTAVFAPAGTGRALAGLGQRRRRELRGNRHAHAGTARARRRGMNLAKVSDCGRFVILEGLHLDRTLFASLERWAGEHGLRVEDAVQMAVWSLTASSAPVAATPTVSRHPRGVPAPR